MKHYTIQEEMRKIFNQLEEIKIAIESLEEKVKKAKIYPQLLNNETWCEIPD